MAEKEYIDKRALLKHQRKMRGCGLSPEDDYWDYAVLAEDIESIPAADVVEVVRCKDCRHYSDFDPYNCKRLSFHFCKKIGNITKEEDFCSYGERKEATP